MSTDYRLLVGLLILAWINYPTEACLGAGVGGCQGLLGCPQTSCGGGCQAPLLPPPPPPACPTCPAPVVVRPPTPVVVAPTNCNCQPTHDCGRYGCYLRRNRVALASVRTQQVDKDVNGGGKVSPDRFGTVNNQTQPVIADPRFPDNPANARFMHCCEDRDLPDACLVHCTFQKYSRDVLNNMYLKTDGCPLPAAADIHFCAAQGRDHRTCCQQNGVTTTLAGEKCLVLCDQRPGQVTQLDLSYLSCYDRFDSIKDCFYQSVMAMSRSG